MGETYHLVAPVPVPSGCDQADRRGTAGHRRRRLDRARSADRADTLEEIFRNGLQEYWPYFQGDPVFDCRNTQAALPDLPAPRVDAALLLG